MCAYHEIPRMCSNRRILGFECPGYGLFCNPLLFPAIIPFAKKFEAGAASVFWVVAPLPTPPPPLREQH